MTKTLLSDEHFWLNVYPKKEPYVFRGGDDLIPFSLQDVQSALQSAELLKKDIYIVENEGGKYIRDYFVGHLNPEATWLEKIEEINQAFRKRYVIKIQGMERWNRALVQVCHSLEDRIQGYVDAHMLLAPSNGGSFGVHTDNSDVFACVLHGRKRFELPDHNLTVDLAPGEWVFIPKGVRHSGFSITNSVLLTFGAREYISDTLQVPVQVGPWYSSLMKLEPSEEWLRWAAEMEDGWSGHIP